MSTHDITSIRNNLESLGNLLEDLHSRELPKPAFADREISGNKIHGGVITNFASMGIVDKSRQNILFVREDGIHVSVAHIDTLAKNVSVRGNLTVDGAITATSLHVNELTADIRNERTSPLHFAGENGEVAYNTGLLWTGGEYTRQFILSPRGNFFSTENIDLNGGKSFMINNNPVLNETSLGSTITSSNLRSVGRLENLHVEGQFSVDQYLFYQPDFQRLGLGTEAPNGAFSIASMDHEFIVDSTDDRKFKLGTYSTCELQLITDDTPRIAIGPNGNVKILSKTSITGALGVNVNNFPTDADITTAGPVRFQGKKFEVASEAPTSGTYVVGDIVWAEVPTSHVGWICVREGTPGVWKSWGAIQQ